MASPDRDYPQCGTCWLLLVGERVAEAAVEQQPGRPERQVSHAEAAALREIAAALRMEE